MDLKGKRFGYLTALRKSGRGRWECECECGKIVQKDARALLTGRNCGCGACLAKKARKPQQDVPVYMKVTTDKYALPIAIADTMGELARICGVDLSVVSHGIENGESGYIKRPSYVCVWIQDEANA